MDNLDALTGEKISQLTPKLKEVVLAYKEAKAAKDAYE
jgi:hypothetical protein